jgi:3-oxoacyl-[acyl-carrier protein] reductase
MDNFCFTLYTISFVKLKIKYLIFTMNIIITGASRGIGYELVKNISSTGNHTIFAVSRNSEKLYLLANECKEKNAATTVIPVGCDLSKENEIQSLIALVKTYTAHIDILINNAGALVNKPFLEISKSDIEYAYSVNVFSTFNLIQNVLPLMFASTIRGHIVNIGSVGGFQGSIKFAGLSAYSSSKAALASLTECLAEEFKEKNVAFNCLALGAVQTEMLNEAFPGYIAPLKANEMATFISQFAMSAHHYLNGKIIPVSMSNP